MRVEEAPSFKASGVCYLKDKLGNSVLLKQSVWEEKISKPERTFLAYNYLKIVETIRNPDHERKSTKNKKARILYKRFDDIWLLPNIKTTFRDGYMVVVIQKIKSGIFVVKTMYTTSRIKK